MQTISQQKAQPTPAIHPPTNVALIGQYCNVSSFNPQIHGQSLSAHINEDYVWDYISTNEKEFKRPTTCAELCSLFKSLGFSFFVIQKKGDDTCYGTFAMMCEPENQAVELGYVLYNKKIQRSVITTEAFYLITKYAFEEAHYNRYFWKCHSLNQPSMSAADRFGFLFEGIKRAHMIQRGAFRHTAYFSTLKSEWPVFEKEFERWLSKDNFDEHGKQITKLKCKEIRQKLEKERE